jgi:LacI family transcriptional regulator
MKTDVKGADVQAGPEEIASRRPGQLPRGSVTIDDVARLAGVSTKTVSRVVNAEPNVSVDTTRAVKQAIAELHYRPNLSARNLAGGRAYLIALLYDNPSDSYLVSLQEGALHACEELGYGLILRPAKSDSTRMVEDVVRFVQEQRLSGVVIAPPLSDMAPLLDALDAIDVRYARISPRDTVRPSPMVTMDHRRASDELTRYLVAQGHRRIAFIKGPDAHGAASLRFEGYLDALRGHGLPVEQKLIAQGSFTFESGEECARLLLAQPEPPTAIFASNDDMAAGVLHTAHERGVRVPDELSVAGFDDSTLSRKVWPSLTTIRQPVRAMSDTAVRMLVAAVRNRQQPSPELPNLSLLAHELIVRTSTAACGDKALPAAKALESSARGG